MGCPCECRSILENVPELDKVDVVMKQEPVREVDDATGEVSYVAPITSVSQVGTLTLDQWLEIGRHFHVLSVGCAALAGLIMGHCLTRLMSR